MAFREDFEVYRNSGTLNAEVGDLVLLNAASMFMGGGPAVIVEVNPDHPGLYRVNYVKNGFETTADDMVDIVEILSKVKFIK